MQSSIQAGLKGDAVWVRVEGKGSFLNSGELKEFTREMITRGYRQFVFDLGACIMMDSTFMGTMAGIALRLKELGRGQLQVVHCGERSRDLLTGLGLDQLFTIHSNGSSAPSCSLLEQSEQNRVIQKQEILEAHEALCEVAPENFAKFKDVLDHLKQTLHPETASN